MTSSLALPLRDGEWRLVYPGMDLAFGTPETPIWNRTTPDVGDVALRVSDVDRPRQDGRAFGIDFRSGRTISFDLGIRSHTDAGVREEVAILTRAWRADAVRLMPGAVAELHVNYDGRRRVVFGRPRRFAPNFSDVTVNQYATAQADFSVIDDLFYSPDVEDIEFGIVPAETDGGLMAPLSSPLLSTLQSDRSTAIRVQTELPAWPVIEISGPIVNPVVTVAGVFEIEVRVDLAHDESVVIDAQPWARSALRNGTANVSGALRGTRLSKAAMPAGTYEVGMRGVDPTGTSSVRISWRPAYGSL